MSLIHIGAHDGAPVEKHPYTITPQHLVVRLGSGRPPFGFIFNRAIRVRVDGPAGTRYIPVINYTRLAQVLIILAGAFAAALINMWRK
jgi:hypothetical protein